MLLILDSEYCIVNICDSTQRKTQGSQTKKTRDVKVASYTHGVLQRARRVTSILQCNELKKNEGFHIKLHCKLN
jgi:hypothetical protein